MKARVPRTIGVLVVLTAFTFIGRGAALQPFLQKHCFECHDPDTQKGGLDLTVLKFDTGNSTNFARWVLVHDRVADGEMPPKKKPRPDSSELDAFISSLSSSLTAVEQERTARQGRATQRRLNRYEYENSLRDLLQAPWLQVREWLPEDGEAFRFNKIGDALDVSHVQMARYLGAADYVFGIQHRSRKGHLSSSRYAGTAQGTFG